MDIRGKIIVVAFLLGSGFMLAMMFPRKATPVWELEPPAAKNDFVLRSKQTATSPSAVEEPEFDTSQQASRNTSVEIRSPQGSQAGPLFTDHSKQHVQPPKLPSKFQSVLVSPQDRSPHRKISITRVQGIKFRKHRIVDGDTLERLARRFLGNPDRYLEIYQWNRDVILDIELLPIGKTIQIPDRDSLPQANGSSTSESVTSSNLVPLHNRSGRPIGSE